MENPRIILVPSGGGKTHMASISAGNVWDLEDILDWPQIHRLYRSTQESGFYELEIDFIRFAAERALPLLIAAASSGCRTLINLITLDNSMVMEAFLTGLHNLFGVGWVDTNDESLDKNIRSRNKHLSPFSFQHRGLIHAYATRSMIRGMAFNAGFPRLDPARVAEQLETTSVPTNVPTASWSDGLEVHHLSEVIPGRWVELCDGQPQYLYRVKKNSLAGITLRCERTTKSCAHNHGECTVSMRITNDATRVTWDPYGAKTLQSENNFATASYSHWVAHPGNRPSSLSKPCTLVYTGSFAPIHRGHYETLEIACRHMERIGYSVTGTYVTPFPVDRRPDKSNWEDWWTSWYARAAITHLSCREQDQVMFDGYLGLEDAPHPLDPKALIDGSHFITSIGDRLRATHGMDPGDLFWVNGSDATYDPRFFESQEFINSGVRMIIVKRPSVACDPRWEALQGTEVCKELPKLSMSSSSVRDHLINGRLAKAREMLGSNLAFGQILYQYHRAGS